MLNTAVRRGQYFDRKSIICMNATVTRLTGPCHDNYEHEQRIARHRLFIYSTKMSPHFDIDEALTFSHHLYAVDVYDNVVSFGV